MKIITVWQLLFSEISGELPVDSYPFYRAIVAIIVNRNSTGILCASKYTGGALGSETAFSPPDVLLGQYQGVESMGKWMH